MDLSERHSFSADRSTDYRRFTSKLPDPWDCAWTCQGISEAVDEVQEWRSRSHTLEGTDQWRQEKPCGPTVHAVGDTRVAALAELESKLRIGDRIDKTAEKVSLVVHDVAVVQGNYVAIARSEKIAIGEPA